MTKILRPTVICSCFVVKNGKILTVLCPKFKKWRVPGGRVDNDESLEETVSREMEEELGITIKDPVFLGWGQDSDFNHQSGKKKPRLLMFFKHETDQDIVPDPEEATDHKWVTLDELKNMDIEGGLMDFLERNKEFSVH